MFKFRRSSLCTKTDVICSSSSSEDEANENSAVKNVLLKKSDSKSRLVRNSTDEKESLSDSSSESVTNSNSTTKSQSRPNNITEILFPTCKIYRQKVSTEDSTGPVGPASAPIEIQEPQPSCEYTATAYTMLDRKRKERHESNSQEQETKVIRANDPELKSDEIIDRGEGRNSEKFVQAQPNSKTNKEIVLENLTPETTHLSIGVVNGMSFTESDSETNTAVLDSSKQQFGYGNGVRIMPMNFEAEKQRAWERTAAQWNSRKIRKSYHRPRHGRSSKSFSEVENVIHATKGDDHQFENLTISPVEISPEEIQATPLQTSDDSPTEGEEEENDLAFDMVDLTPRIHPSLDFSTLHHHVDSQEPLTCRAAHYPSSDQVMLSPRNSIIRTEGMDPSIPPSPPLHQIPVDPPISRQILDGNQDTKINTLTRQTANLKKQIKILEEEYELLMGYKPSHADKLNNKEMKKHLLALSKLKRELKQIREDPSSVQGSGGNGSTLLLGVYKNFTPGGPPGVFGLSKEKSLENLEITVRNVEKTLVESRKVASRPDDLLLMTHSELLREKSSMQKELISLEKRYGRPESKEEKELVRNLYDRYRTVKKLSGRISFSTVKENSLDLAPILEHEALDFQGDSDIPKISVIELKKEATTSPKSRRRRFGQQGSSSSVGVERGIEDGFRNEDYNDMATGELELKCRLAIDEKRKLRMSLRRFESDFQNQTGRFPQKEDKYGSGEIELVYQKYKHIRGIVRLLQVLINKRKFPHLIVDLTKVEVED